MTEVTRILLAIEAGDPSAASQLLPLVYDELRKLAAQKLAQEKPGQTPRRCRRNRDRKGTDAANRCECGRRERPRPPAAGLFSRRFGVLSFLPDPSYAVGIKPCVGADNRYAFHHGLSDQQSVKRVAVVPRQSGLYVGVIYGDRHDAQIQVGDGLRHPLPVR